MRAARRLSLTLSPKKNKQSSKYKKTRCIGSGVSSTVWHGKKSGSKDRVALKCVKKSYWKKHRESVEREIEVQTKVSHPNVTKLLEHYSVDGSVVLVLERACCSLANWMANPKDKNTRILVRYVAHQIIQGLVVVHSLGYVHRDVKRDNVLLFSDGKVKLTDFGSVISVEEAVCSRHFPAGTPQYFPPEAALTSGYDQKFDVW
eukprot:CAMPEP_0168509416 /NCGR_PEP_ID=MMETSP0405-20121227/759_1 /TAXON_ID=498012 /ORGANISM="Trichosphaerium sp, Strain Am-I-7 wt" /LENGTH=202 /DNA_ID=CAMNT_0008526863 /DNA_START=301 /DNA_END=906 /DNA_ORIENTATION=-